MAIQVQVQAQLNVNDGLGGKALNTNLSYAPTGQRFFVKTQVAGTAAAAMSLADLASMRYLELVNPSSNTATVTVTMAPIILKPGDIFIGPTSAAPTLQATAAATEIASAGTEV